MKYLKIITLTLLCLVGGYGFSKINPNDPLITFFFTLGLLGIMMSWVRESKK